MDFRAAWTSLGIPPGSSVVIGVSGGMDSMALLHGLCALRKEGLVGTLHAAHLDHGIRGESAREDASFVEKLAGDWGVSCTVEHMDVPALAARKRIGLEEAARLARYEFLARVREARGADYIAVAHHGDDQAETVLLHLLRGTGLTGLCGMRPRNGFILRPLLGVCRAEIETYVRSHAIPFREDETNAVPDCMRNRLRLRLLPLLAEEYNPGIRQGLCRMAALCARDEDCLHQQGVEALQEARLAEGSYRRSLLAALHPALRSRAAREILREHGILYDAGEALTARLAELFSARTGARLNLSEGLWAWTSYDTLHVGVPGEVEAYAVPFVREGETHLPDGRVVSGFVKARTKEGPFVAHLDDDRLPEGLVVRTRLPGDRFHPLGAPGERKLKEFFIDRKVPREARQIPMLCAGERVLFLPGFTIAQEVRVTEGTRRILRVAFEMKK